ncbi:MAG: DNA repair protein RecO [Mucilaginibacter polytrichastri]|nr:DNA repair protein RecO [Mucilaginibacter polytrichastri]
MLHKTRGIVFRTTNYGESSVVAQIFTEKFGVQSYLINGVKKPRAKIPMNLLQPLHLLDMVVYYKDGGTLQRIAEAKAAPVLHTLPYDVVKSSIAIFLNEVLYKSVKQQTPEESLFHYVFSSVEWLDGEHRGVANFHVLFMIQLSRYLGFFPAKPGSGDGFFDLQEGVFTNRKPAHSFFIGDQLNELLKDLLKIRFDELFSLRISAGDRRNLLYKLLDYYAMHVEGFGHVRSHVVLEEVLG